MTRIVILRPDHEPRSASGRDRAWHLLKKCRTVEEFERRWMTELRDMPSTMNPRAHIKYRVKAGHIQLKEDKS
jgi:hypothetical protein